MGGGDLNTKKSWHPNTMKNQERVWKAEQQEAAEKRRLNELRREIDEERNREELKSIGQKSGILPSDDGDKKLEWMYRGPSQLVNREEYLLGRTIDKTFEELDAQEKQQAANSTFGVAQPKNHVEHECIPFSIRQHKDVLSNDQVDLARKLMEDPLMLIKQREMESRQKILQNPVKLKELHRLLKGDQSLKAADGKKGKKKDKKKDKKSKKSKKMKKQKSKRRSEGSESVSDSEGSADLDKLLAEKYKKVAGEHQEGVSIDKLLTMKYEKLTKELDMMEGSGSKKKKQRCDRSDDSVGSDRRDTRRRADSRQGKREEYGGRDDRDKRSKERGRNPSRDRSREVRKSRRDSSEEATKDRKRERKVTHPERDRSRDTQRNRSPPRSSHNRSPVRKDAQPQKDKHGRGRSRSRSPERKQSYKDTKRRSRSRSPRRRSRSPREHSKPKTKPRRTPSNSSSSSSGSDSNTPEQKAQSRPAPDDSDDERRIRKVKNFGLVTASGQKLETSSRAEVRLYKREEIKAEQSKQRPTWSKPQEKKRPLSEKELEERRLAMMSNAQWRERERESNVKRYESEDHREEARECREFDKEFLTKQLKRAAASETVESRIRSNRNNIQRSNGAMDRNFVKR